MLLLVGLSAIALIVEGFLLYSYRSLITPYVLDAILQTNFKEAREFFIAFLNLKIFLIALGFLLAGYGYFKFFPTPQTTLSPRLIGIFFALYVLLSVIFIADVANRYFKHKPEPFAKLNENSLTRLFYSIRQYYGSTSFYTSYKQLVSNYQALRESYQGKISKSSDSPQHIVLVIGESTQRNFLEVYGYELPNTPFLRSFANNEGGGGRQLALFSDTIASFAQTKLALQHLLNFSNAGDSQWNQSLDLINLFSLAGYKTAVFSNQEVVGSEVNAFSSIASLADYKANLNKFITSSRIAESQITYDGFLLPFIQSALEQNPTESRLDIIHLMGTHFNYDKRYPKEFAKFNANDIHYPSFADKKQKEIIATYANAVLYNDYILNEIFKIYAKSDSIIFYLSDHGESLYEYKGKLGHFVTSRFTAEVPFLALMSEEFIQKHKETAQKIQSAKDKPFVIDDLIHLLCDVAQIQVQDYNATKNPLSAEFNAKKIRIFNQKADYDKELKGEIAQPK